MNQKKQKNKTKTHDTLSKVIQKQYTGCRMQSLTDYTFELCLKSQDMGPFILQHFTINYMMLGIIAYQIHLSEISIEPIDIFAKLIFCLLRKRYLAFDD